MSVRSCAILENFSIHGTFEQDVLRVADGIIRDEAWAERVCVI